MLTLQETGAPAIDPETGQPWPRWLDTAQAARFATQVIGIQIEAQTLANYRAAGKGPSWKYFGQKSLTTPTEIERWAAEDALTDVSPLTRRARERERAARRSAHPSATKGARTTAA
jgi:hypothetical protein